MPRGVVEQIDIAGVHIDSRNQPGLGRSGDMGRKAGQSIAPPANGNNMADIPAILRRGRSRRSGSSGGERED